MKIICVILTCILLLSPLSVLFVSALDTVPENNTADILPAEDITKDTRITARGFDRSWPMTDGAFRYYCDGGAGATVTLSAGNSIGGIYILFDETCESWSISASDGPRIEKQEEFIHQYVDIAEVFGEDCRSLTLTFERGARISEIYVLGLGACPEWVQRWESTPERTDILLISAHSDDEHLFFAGILPYYTSQGRIVTVAYLTEHNDKHERRHERLNGLWRAGVRYYPVGGGINDRYSTDMEWAKSNLIEDGHTASEVDSFIVELFRMTRPLVVFTHDFEGEYKHGQHILLADSVARMLKVSADGTVYPESADKYGTYEVPKAYFHLWTENRVEFAWDEPCAQLGGRTPFEVSRDAFLCHESQLNSKFYKWIFGDEEKTVNKASDIEEHSPLQFGLYHSTVGYSTGRDIFEGLIAYSDRGKPQPTLPPETTEANTDAETVPTETTLPDIDEGTLPAETALPDTDGSEHNSTTPYDTSEADSDAHTSDTDKDSDGSDIVLLPIIFGCACLVCAGGYVYMMFKDKK